MGKNGIVLVIPKVEPRLRDSSLRKSCLKMYNLNEIKLKTWVGMKPGLMEYHTTMKELGWYNIKAVRKIKRLLKR